MSNYSTVHSLVAQLVKNLPAAWETWVRSLCWEDPLEEGMAMTESVPRQPDKKSRALEEERGVWGSEG